MSRYGTSGAICCLALSNVLACTPSRAPASRAPAPASYPSDVVLTSVVATSSGSTRSSPVSPASTVQPSRQVIRRGQIDVQVATLSTARERLERAVSASGAQVTRATVNERERAEYFIKVPPDRLDALMDSTAALGEVESRSVGVEDVTERVIDAEARLASLRASRDRLRQLLERAATVQDVISVERELARIQAEIESLDARLTALRGQVALSELTVTMRQRPVLGPLGVVAAGLGTGVRKLFLWR